MEDEDGLTGGSTVYCRPLRGAGLPARSVVFPGQDPSGLMGQVFLRGPARGSGLAYGSHHWWNQGWRPGGPAQGEVLVPAGNQLKVQIGRTLDSFDVWGLEVAEPDAVGFTDACSAAGAAPLLACLTTVRAVDLWSLGVGDDVAGELSGCPSLEAVNLWGTRVGDAGLASVAALPRLRSLVVPGRSAGDGAALLLGGLPRLRELDLAGAALTDRGLRALVRATSLARLSLWGTRVSDAGLACLAALPHLTELDLGNTAVTDGAIPVLASLPLRRLSLTDSLVTPSGLQSLRTRLPGCRVEPHVPQAGCLGHGGTVRWRRARPGQVQGISHT